MVWFCSGNVQRSDSKCFGVNRGQAFSTQLVCGNPNVGVANRVHENLRGMELLGTNFEKHLLMTFFTQEFVGGKEGSALFSSAKGWFMIIPYASSAVSQWALRPGW